ncbi:P22 phage major capsid protein family protein [Pseudomonas sp. MONT-RG-20F-20-E-7-02]|uniref:P22 phage major capsid protein family protein n=1 Tax=Pseudomonas sp. MONT-RG-20F-20-E-7-02 TaxID=2914979 RepID=UPI001F5AD73F|nr:P22 phage major capsid protein family protein [Pseudomonas sp. MONT-RG-20F-20-E-7-02]
MANALLTPSMITREALRIFKNTNLFLRNIDTQYDDSFAKSGAKIGDTLRIRLPNEYVTRTGKVATPQDTVERSVPLTVATQQGVDVAFSSAERALSLDDYSNRILLPAMNTLAGTIATNVMQSVESFSNLTFKGRNADGTGTIATPDAGAWLDAGALLDNTSTPRMNARGNRKAILDPRTQARTVTTLAGLFNNQQKIGDQYKSGEMGMDTLGFDWGMDQTVIKHTNGSYTAGAVAGAGQTGASLTVAATTGTFNKGDVICIAGVFGTNPVTKQSTGELRQFVVTANVASGATTIPIYPSIIPGVVAYGTVTASPANGALITLVGGASTTFRKNFVMDPMAVTMATADLELPRGVHEAYRETYDGVSLRFVTAYDVVNDNFISRFDVLYGWATVRPEWGAAVADIL